MAVATRERRQELIGSYKLLLRQFIDQRPSGMRRKIAEVLGTHKSFISQITNPVDPTPIPVRHLDPIGDVCHFSQAERERLMEAYLKAHPEHRRAGEDATPRHYRTLHVQIPVLADPDKQRALEALVRDTVRRLCELIDDH
jgi:hypothetical protein